MQEASRFAEMFKKDEFREELFRYMEEISSDDARKVRQRRGLVLLGENAQLGSRQEQEALIAQMERESAIPSDVHLVRPKPHFVLKFKTESDGKVFVNVCSTPECGPLDMKPSTDGRAGAQVAMPTLIGQPRTGKDKDGNPSTIIDLAVHSTTIEAADRNSALMKLLCETVGEQVLSALGKFTASPIRFTPTGALPRQTMDVSCDLDE